MEYCNVQSVPFLSIAGYSVLGWNHPGFGESTVSHPTIRILNDNNSLKANLTSFCTGSAVSGSRVECCRCCCQICYH